jgi:hypothetical protein
VGSVRRSRRWIAIAAGAAVAAALGVAFLAVSLGRGSSAPTVDRLPDLRQKSPFDLSGKTVRTRTGTRFRLGFASAVDNVGAGPLVVVGRRKGGPGGAMVATQLVRRSDGSTRRVAGVGRLHYTVATTHQHWHYLRFDRYELRTVPRGKLVRPDRKTGFCLGDRYQTDPTVLLRDEPEVAVWTDECGKAQPLLPTVLEGISVGYGDVYYPLLEGQYVDVTGLAAGRYELVHRVNADRALRETDYDNDAASVLLDLSWPKGPRHEPAIDVVARCGDGRRCRSE